MTNAELDQIVVGIILTDQGSDDSVPRHWVARKVWAHPNDGVEVSTGRIDHSLRRLKRAGMIRLTQQRGWRTTQLQKITQPVSALAHPVEK